MSESLSLKELSERATPGEWSIYVETTPDLTAAEGEAVMLVRDTPEFSGSMVMLNASGLCPALTGCGKRSLPNAELIVALVNEYRAGRLHTSEDLAFAEAAAHAKGRAEGIGEAVKIAEDPDIRRNELGVYIRALLTTGGR